MDYNRPFERMPALHRLPTTGKLPFASDRVELLPIGFQRVHVGAGAVGAYINLPSDSKFEWTIRSELSSVDRRGREFGPTRGMERTVSHAAISDGQISLGFHVGAKPAFYRFDVVFRSKAGRFLSHYAEYFRVVRKRLEVRLAMNGRRYSPGERILFRLENWGTAWIFYGLEFEVERWTGTAWEHYPVTPEGWTLEGFGSISGGESECQGVHLGDDAGRYRITKEVSARLASPNFPVRAYFEVNGQ